MGKIRQGGGTLACPWCNLVGWQRHEYKNFLKHVLKRHGVVVPEKDVHECASIQGGLVLRKRLES